MLTKVKDIQKTKEKGPEWKLLVTINKTLNMHNKKRLLRASRGEDQVTYKIRHNRTTTDFFN